VRQHGRLLALAELEQRERERRPPWRQRRVVLAERRLADAQLLEVRARALRIAAHELEAGARQQQRVRRVDVRELARGPVEVRLAQDRPRVL
jgi:hypothetical protein